MTSIIAFFTALELISIFNLYLEILSLTNINVWASGVSLDISFIKLPIILKFSDQPEILKKAYFEITYTSIVKVNKKVSDKKEMEKIILCDVPNKIYPNLERIFLNLLTDSGYPGIKFEKKVDFTEMYKQRAN